VSDETDGARDPGRNTAGSGGLTRPDEYSDAEWAAYREGYADAMTQIGRLALDGAASLRPDSSEQDGDDEDPEKCATCGAGLLSSMGADETESSPEGYVCPECELG
jgi:hypothetical protein